MFHSNLYSVLQTTNGDMPNPNEYTVIKGERGEPGPKGDKGDVGPAGPPGPIPPPIAPPPDISALIGPKGKPPHHGSVHQIRIPYNMLIFLNIYCLHFVTLFPKYCVTLVQVVCTSNQKASHTK